MNKPPLVPKHLHPKIINQPLGVFFRVYCGVHWFWSSICSDRLLFVNHRKIVMSRRSFILIFITIVAISPIEAHAISMGDTVTYDFSAYGEATGIGLPTTITYTDKATVGAGIEFSGTINDQDYNYPWIEFAVDISPSSGGGYIDYTYKNISPFDLYIYTLQDAITGQLQIDSAHYISPPNDPPFLLSYVPPYILNTNSDNFYALTQHTLTYRVEYFTSTPVPPAAWLFGSGLIGLIGVARRKVRV